MRQLPKSFRIWSGRWESNCIPNPQVLCFDGVAAPFSFKWSQVESNSYFRGELDPSRRKFAFAVLRLGHNHLPEPIVKVSLLRSNSQCQGRLEK